MTAEYLQVNSSANFHDYSMDSATQVATTQWHNRLLATTHYKRCFLDHIDIYAIIMKQSHWKTDNKNSVAKSRQNNVQRTTVNL